MIAVLQHSSVNHRIVAACKSVQLCQLSLQSRDSKRYYRRSLSIAIVEVHSPKRLSYVIYSYVNSNVLVIIFVVIMASDLIVSFLQLDFIVGELQDVAFKILPTLKMPPQNLKKLITMIADWVRDDRPSRVPNLIGAADRYVPVQALRAFLVHQCNYADKVLNRCKKPDLWRMACDMMIGEKPVSAGKAPDPAPYQLVEARPLRRLQKKLKREWAKGASLMRRQLISGKIKKAFKQYTKENCADRTIGEVRAEIGNTVGISLEHGEARLFFDRQLRIHWLLVFKGIKHKKRRRVVRPKYTPREIWERKRMRWENALSQILCD